MSKAFRWNAWNIGHIAHHGIDPADAEFIVLSARAPWPSYEGDGKWLVRGQTADGTYLQVVYVIDPPGEIYVIHCRPLVNREKKIYRRRKR